MNKSQVRVRFAPAPTGTMHIGNIRTALMNFLFARQKNGTFILRIEDTDRQRDFDPSAQGITTDLGWLHLTYDEGPGIGGPDIPYFQSQRSPIYQKHLEILQSKGAVYRCFCSEEELERKRERQRALKLPPRYDRTCARLSEKQVQEYLADKKPFLWRILLPHIPITIHDLSKGAIEFDLKNFSDFPLTRQDGSFTFMFANFVDDLVMHITHVFRGEDHLSNTAGQSALYRAFEAPLPQFWHMPMLCNTDGKKLSKRDFAFSVRDLQREGFLPESVINYLAILGGSYAQEVMSLDELITSINFENPHTTGQIRYDVEKLRWLNHQWIIRYDAIKLAQICRPYLASAYQTIDQLSDDTLAALLQTIKTDLHVLTDAIKALNFYFNTPTLQQADLAACIEKNHRSALYKIVTQYAQDKLADNFIEAIKKETAAAQIPTKELFWFLRLALMNNTHGPAIHGLIHMLGTQESHRRIVYALQLLKSIS